jgi:hypothetical protein
MSRVINTDSPGKRRSQSRRTIAEMLLLLGRKTEVDEETKDMAAMTVYLLRDMESTVTESVEAWEKRGYWMKAERFLRDWMWIRELAVNIEDVIRHEAWDLLPELLFELSPRFNDISLKTMTRKPDAWRGAYQRLLAEPPSELPW